MAKRQLESFKEESLVIHNRKNDKTITLTKKRCSKGAFSDRTIPCLATNTTAKEVIDFLGDELNEFVITHFNILLNNTWNSKKGNLLKFVSFLEKFDPIKAVLNAINSVSSDLNRERKKYPRDEVKIKELHDKLGNLFSEYSSLINK